MGNAKYVSKLCGYDIPLGPVRYDMNQANLTIKWRPDIQSQTAYVLDETEIDIPDIPKFRPTAKRVYLDKYLNSTGWDWLVPIRNRSLAYWIHSLEIPFSMLDKLAKNGLAKEIEWTSSGLMLKDECYILDEC